MRDNGTALGKGRVRTGDLSKPTKNKEKSIKGTGILKGCFQGQGECESTGCGRSSRQPALSP